MAAVSNFVIRMRLPRCYPQVSAAHVQVPIMFC